MCKPNQICVCLSNIIIFLFFVIYSVQSASKAHPGKIVSLELCPINHNLILIGYEKGVIVLWDFESGLPTKNFPVSIQDCQEVLKLVLPLFSVHCY